MANEMAHNDRITHFTNDTVYTEETGKIHPLSMISGRITLQPNYSPEQDNTHKDL
jgi:hypothetical protein